ncbi:hypothetical protein [Kitasatospora sp. NPDC088779]|uniref:hypothetical protein n=1 Tax=unclassified Kitasatospora TaxID=2633591 RepID=UPI003433225E
MGWLAEAGHDVNPLLIIDGQELRVVQTPTGWALLISTSSTVELSGPSDTSAQAQEWLHQYAAWRLWPLARTRGPWGCLALASEGWMTALARTALPPTVQVHLGVQEAEVHAAAHLIVPAGSSTEGSTSLPPGVRAVQERFWPTDTIR